MDSSASYWHQHVVYTPQWWTIVALMILPWAIWWKLADRSRMLSLLCVGVQIALFAFTLDNVGASLGLWTYPYTLTPLPREVWDPADFAILPVSYMLMYQWWPQWRAYLVASVVFSLFAAFGGGNLFEWADIYRPLHWSHLYSVPGYFLLGLIAKTITEAAARRQSLPRT
ncbi:hypothetical protein MO973_04890 [Paenibacillus sp. TRM 82003]|nr:hypothetical protein [Paenibacillus sp. TRM 82003]